MRRTLPLLALVLGPACGNNDSAEPGDNGSETPSAAQPDESVESGAPAPGAAPGTDAPSGAPPAGEGSADDEDEAPQEETPEDETPEEETPEGETPEGETPDDETPDDEAPDTEQQQALYVERCVALAECVQPDADPESFTQRCEQEATSVALGLEPACLPAINSVYGCYLEADCGRVGDSLEDSVCADTMRDAREACPQAFPYCFDSRSDFADGGGCEAQFSFCRESETETYAFVCTFDAVANRLTCACSDDGQNTRINLDGACTSERSAEIIEACSFPEGLSLEDGGEQASNP